jgi:hypothetical protein
MGLRYESNQPCSSRGVSGDDPEGGARRGVPRLRLVTAASGGSETARRALRPGLRGARCTCCGGNAGAGSADPKPKIATVERREARLPPAEVGCIRLRPLIECRIRVTRVREGGRHPRKVPGLQRYCRSRVPAGTRAPVGAPPTPRSGWTRSKLGRFAPRERDGLFDIVRRKLSWPASAFARRRASADKLGRDM